MAETLEDIVKRKRAEGKSAIMIQKEMRDEGYSVPWVSVLKAFRAAG